MHWIVQNNIKDEDSYEKFIQALCDLHIEHTLVNVVPFSHEIIPDVNPIGEVIVWGSTTLDLIAKNRGWLPGTYSNENFDQRIWGEKYKGFLLNEDAEFYEFGNIPEYNDVRFIRPVLDTKIFAGEVVCGSELERWKKSISAIEDGYSTLTSKTLVSVSKVKNIEFEDRFFIVNGKVITGSSYRQFTKSFFEEILPPETRPVEGWLHGSAWNFAQAMAHMWSPSNAFVLDIATIEEVSPRGNHTHKVIEINSITSSGFYAANMFSVVEAVENEQNLRNWSILLNLKDLVKDKKVYFEYYHDKKLWYRTENNELVFPVDIEDTGIGYFKPEDKAIYFMRWIRRQLESDFHDSWKTKEAVQELLMNK